MAERAVVLATPVKPKRQRARRPKPVVPSPPDPGDAVPPDPGDAAPPDPDAAGHKRRRHNATERTRVQGLNEAFARLREACDLPASATKKDVIDHACSIITLARAEIHPPADAAHMFDDLL